MYWNDIIFKYHTHTHTHITKYLHFCKIYKCNKYELNKRKLISKSDYRCTAQHSTVPILTSMHKRPPPPKKVQYKLQNSINIFTYGRINNIVLLLQAIHKSWARYMYLSWVVLLCKRRSCFNSCFFTKLAWQFRTSRQQRQLCSKFPHSGHTE